MHMKQKGFTLMEILVAISIIAILTAAGIVSFSGINQRSRDARRKSDIEQVRSALEMYRTTNGYYPDVSASLTFVALSELEDTLVPTYLPEIPVEPKDPTTYSYQIRMSDVANAHNYGYCISALVEEQSVAKTTCGDLILPSGTDGNVYNYGVRNP